MQIFLPTMRINLEFSVFCHEVAVERDMIDVLSVHSSFQKDRSFLDVAVKSKSRPYLS